MLDLLYQHQGRNASLIREHRQLIYILQHDYDWWMAHAGARRTGVHDEPVRCIFVTPT